MEDYINLTTFQNLPVELQYAIADNWTIEEVFKVLENYNRPLNYHERFFKTYLETRKNQYTDVLMQDGPIEVARRGDLFGVQWLADNNEFVDNIWVHRAAKESGNHDLVDWLDSRIN